MSYYCNRRAIKIHQFIPYIELLLCVRHLVVGKGKWAFLKEGCDLVMGVRRMIFWLSGKEQKQSNLGMWGGEWRRFHLDKNARKENNWGESLAECVGARD